MPMNSQAREFCDLSHSLGYVMKPDRRRDPGAVNKIFGSELPSEPPDESDREAARAAGDHDQWLRDNVPPHHD